MGDSCSTLFDFPELLNSDLPISHSHYSDQRAADAVHANFDAVAPDRASKSAPRLAGCRLANAAIRSKFSLQNLRPHTDDPAVAAADGGGRDHVDRLGKRAAWV